MIPTLCTLALFVGQMPPPSPPDPTPPGPKGPDVVEVIIVKPSEPKKYTVKAGEFIKWKADADKAYWGLPPGTPNVSMAADGSYCTFGSLVPAVYYVSCSAGGPVTWLEVTVKPKDDNVTPPGPKPPGPVIPPTPPTPPVPVDPLVELIRGVMDKTADRAYRTESGKDVAALLRQFVKIVNRDGIGTTGQLGSALADAMQNFPTADGKPLGLPNVRKLLVTELVKVVGLPNVPLTADVKVKVAEFFERFAKSVEAVSAE